MATQKENKAPLAPGMSSGELKMMLGQCLKMASENKITASNTWGLPLIEHLDDLIKEDDPNRHTNFQKASVTLDAGVKIYSYRVDSVHTETFKILGGLGRASGSGDDQEGDPGEGQGIDGENGSPSKRKRRPQDLNPEATLESNFEALNVKKFDLAFAVDPLFHKTSAQFDEGGAKGLLMNNLSVYRGCDIVFDSADVPETAVENNHTPSCAGVDSSAAHHVLVDLDLVRPQVDAIVGPTNVKEGQAMSQAMNRRISPTLDDIMACLHPPSSLSTSVLAGNEAAAQADEFVHSVAEGLPPNVVVVLGGDGGVDHADDDGDGLDSSTSASVEIAVNNDYQGGNGDGGLYDDCDGYYGGDDATMTNDDGMMAMGDAINNNNSGSSVFEASSALEEDAITWLITAGGSTSTSYVTSSKGWAGASHWRYRAVQSSTTTRGDDDANDDDTNDDQTFRAIKKSTRTSKKNQPLDFVALMANEDDEPKFDMLPRKKGKGVQSSSRGTKAKTLLPEDYHYKPEWLARYALRPRTVVSISSYNNNNNNNGANGNYGASAAALSHLAGNDVDNEGADHFEFSGGEDYDGGDNYHTNYDYDNANVGLIDEQNSNQQQGWAIQGEDVAQASHRVDKVEVNYSRAAKQVDVKELKELMWSGIQQVMQRCQEPSTNNSSSHVIEFSDILSTVPEINGAGSIEDLSIHLCFICVLHLANEHGLVVQGVPELDRLLVSNVPVAAVN